MSNEIKITNHAIPATARSKNHQSPTSSGSVYINSGSGGSVGGAPQLIKLGSSLAPSDDNVLSSLRALFEIRSCIVASDNTETELSEENTLSSLHTIAEIDAAIKLALIDIEKLYLSKTKADTATEAITFLKGLLIGDNIAHIDANGDAEVRNIVARIKAKVATLEVTGSATVGSLAAKESVTSKTVAASEQITTLNLLVQALANTYDLNVSHVATMMRTIIKDYVSSEAFTPGLTGEGFKISKSINGDWNLEIDNVVVRKVMTIFEMIISKVRSVNGGLVISDGNGRIKSVAETTGSPAYYVIGIEGDMQFVVDDYVRCQVFSSGHAKFYWVRVSSISGNSILVLKSEFTNGAVPAIGDDLVQMGNATNTARQGLIYLTASEDGKPRISVMDGVNSTSLVGKNKVILGCLDGITDTDFPADFQPSGYGLYAMNVFLKGIFVLRSGKSVEGEIEAAQNAAATAQAKADTVTRLFQEFTVAGGLFESKITEVKEYADGKVNAVQVGGRNLVINSAKRIDSNSYHIGNYVLSRDMLDGEELTITVWGQLAEGQTVYIGRSPSSAMIVNLARGLDGTYSGKFLFNILPAYPNDVRNVIQLYNYKQTGNLSCRIDRIKVERGNKPTDWTPAPEDVTADAQATANAAQAAAEAVAIAKATLAKTEASAYADGIVTAEERRAIADAQAKLAEAKRDAQAKADDAKQAAINDAASKYPTKTEFSTSITQLSNSISLKAEKTEVTDLGTRVSNAEAKITPDAINLTVQSQVNTAAQEAIAKVTKLSSYNVGVYNPQGSAGVFLFKTKIVSRSNQMIVVDVDGYMYGNSDPFGVSLVLYTFHNGLTSYGYTVNGVDIVDRIRIAENAGFLAIELRLKTDVYFPGFSVKISSTRVAIPVSYSENWEFNYEYLSYGDLFDGNYSDVCIVPKKDTYAESYTKAQVQILSDQIALKVSNDTFNALGNRVSAAEATLTVQANQIASKVSQNDFNTLGQRVGSAESAITQQAAQISSKVSTTEFDKLGVRVSSAESEIKQQANQISLMVKKDDLTITGIDITNRKIVLTADSTVFKNNAGQQIAMFENNKLKVDLIDARAIVTGALVSEVISATNITTGKLTVTDNAKIGEFLVQSNSLVNYDFRASLQIGDSESLRYVKIGGDSLNLAKIQVAGENAVGLNITTYKPTVGRYPHTNYAIKSVGSHVFKQRGAVDQYDRDDIWDAPGVLWAGRVNAWGTLENSWGNGCTASTRRTSDGNYTISHNLGHNQYYAIIQCTPYATDGWRYMIGMIGAKGLSSFDIALVDAGQGLRNCAFEVFIVGRNKF